MKQRFTLIFLLIPLAGCGAPAQLAPVPTLNQLRELARDQPNNPRVQSDLAIGEIFALNGDPTRVLPQLKRALALNQNSIRLEFIAALYHDLHGDLDQALLRYLTAIRLAADSKDAIAPQVSEVAINAVQGLRDGVAGYRQKVRSGLEPIAGRSLVLAAPARYAVNELLIDLAYGRGDLEKVKQIALRAGCLTAWRAAGPFGPRGALGFDRDDWVRPGATLLEQYDLGPGRGVRATREVESRGCNTYLGNGPVTLEGTSYAQADLELATGGDYLLRLETPNNVELFIDGVSVQRIDFRKHLSATIHYLPVKLKAGRRKITIKLTSAHTNPVLSLAVSPLVQADREAVDLPFRGEPPLDINSGFARYLTAATLLVRGDVIAARETLRSVDDLNRSSTLLLLQRAGVALSDPLVPPDQRSDNAGRLFRACSKRDPGLWSPQIQLAQIEATNGRVTEAIERLRKAAKRWPEVIAIDLSLIELLRERDWHTEADMLVKKIRERLPDSCKTLQAELEASRRRRYAQDVALLSDASVACDARSSARYATLIAQRRWNDARLELNRLAALEPDPNGFGLSLARLFLARNLEDDREVSETIDELRARFPRSETALIDEVDTLFSRGQVQPARAALDRAFRQEPASTLALRRLGTVVTGDDALARYRVDGIKMIRDFEASQRSYDQPQVLVFDYMVVRVFEDGSAIELVHNIFKVQSDEAVDELGEIRVPESARLLKARTIKADKRCIEPDQISGKETVSLPDLLPGDYTEMEYVRTVDPPNGFPGGVLGDRFYFRSFEVPFDLSRLIVVLPRDMPVTVDPRGEAPALQETIEDDLRVLSWKVQASRPLIPEPSAVAEREFIPSINYGVKATWDGFVESILDALIDRNIADPAVDRLVQEIVGEAAPDDGVIRARRLYEWVVRNIENTTDSFSQAAMMLRARRGNRARILHYLLKAADLPSQLALVRNLANDATLSDLADTATYDNLLLMITPAAAKGIKRPIWLSTVDRWAPFGYVPPLLRGQRALLLDEGARFVMVRPDRPGEDRHLIDFDIQLRADGSAKIGVVERIKGAGATAWRENLEGIAEAELRQRFEQEYVSHLVPGAELGSLRIIAREEADLPFQLEYSFTVGNFGRQVERSWALPGIVLSQLSAAYARTASRTTPEIISPAVDRVTTLKIRVPKGFGMPRLPKSASVRGPNRSSFALRARVERGALLVRRELKLPQMRVEPEHYAELRKFCRDVDLAEATEMVFKMPSRDASQRGTPRAARPRRSSP